MFAFVGAAAIAFALGASAWSSWSALGAEFFGGELAVLIFVEFAEGFGGVFDFALGELAVFVGVEGLEEGVEAHEAAAGSSGTATAAFGRLSHEAERGHGECQ